MDIHKPHPIQSWRELFSEIGVIVIGVLIALSAEQVVETLHWRHKIAESEDAVRLELREDDGPQAYARAMIGACLDRQVDRMEAALKSGRRDAYLAAARAYAPAGRTWDSEAWRALVASDVGAHIGAARLVQMSDPYRLLPFLNDNDAREQNDLLAARALREDAGKITTAEADRLNEALIRLRADERGMSTRTLFLLLLVREQVGVSVSAQNVARIRTEAQPRYGDCVIDPYAVSMSTFAGEFSNFDDVFEHDYGQAAKAGRHSTR